MIRMLEVLKLGREFELFDGSPLPRFALRAVNVGRVPCDAERPPSLRTATGCAPTPNKLAALQVRPRLGHRPLVDFSRRALIWLTQVITGRATHPRPDYSRKVSAAFEGFASTRLGQFFGPAADRSGPVRLQPLEPRARGLHRSSGAGRHG